MIQLYRLLHLRLLRTCQWSIKVCTTSNWFSVCFGIVPEANGLPWTSLADPQSGSHESHDEHQTGPSIDDIRIEYHPHSERPAEILPLKDYQERQRKIKTPKLNTHQPWKPFQTRAEFEFAEVALKAGLSKNQADTLILLMKRCIRGEETFEIDSHAHLCEIWNAGAVLHTAVGSSRIVWTFLTLW